MMTFNEWWADQKRYGTRSTTAMAWAEAAWHAAKVATKTTDADKLRAIADDVPRETQGWISVDERLPELGMDVLTCDDTGFMEVAYLLPNGWVNNDVTHWMPLPAAPIGAMNNCGENTTDCTQTKR